MGGVWRACPFVTRPNALRQSTPIFAPQMHFLDLATASGFMFSSGGKCTAVARGGSCLGMADSLSVPRLP